MEDGNGPGYPEAMAKPIIHPHLVTDGLTTATLATLLGRIGEPEGEELATAICWPVADDLADALAASLPLDADPTEDAVTMSLEEVVATLKAAQQADADAVVLAEPAQRTPARTASVRRRWWKRR